MFDGVIPPGFGAFMAAQRVVAISGEDDDGRVWCTVLTGPPGFVDAVDERNIVLHAVPPDGDPLADALTRTRDLGMVVMSPSTARRVRVNGKARRDGDRLVVHTEQVLGNCPKYLQVREVVEVADAAAGPAVVGDRLTDAQRAWIEAADTFFIGSRSPADGADASHRGGLPGFVTVSAPDRLSWPDYTGNSFYMTLGNIELNPLAGLVFLDWTTGSTLQLAGRCQVDWRRQRAGALPGALRVVDFHVERVVQIDGASTLRWALRGYSRFNPPVPMDPTTKQEKPR
ncbi:pyridoxamine 5'-phosphate oxidase family protein [Saccharothrix longispora]|uniref:pyridoxamine 5'-phosphate oxidase family protein n=1 Tax=Saccharothrix longispora TaxID=33920 RepID=UPI0028FD0C19|nr:pyridoxamine 5'-phosphate oxidase family protein [Saccharothrix longispora]MDU0290769.1 pyridoxamine 5'-phosphate oxidase family protein [Saccharothrix longispora]